MKECIHAITIRLHQIECVKCAIDNTLCEENPNCYYKKLQEISQLINKKHCQYDGLDICIMSEIQQIINEDR